MAATARPGQLGIATPFGELLGKSDAEMHAELQDYADMGVDWVRLDIHWSFVQPTRNGGFNWTLVDKVFNAVDAKGFEIVAILNNTPGWIGSSLSSAADQAAYAKFASEAAKRYGHIVDHYEVYNEPNMNGVSPQDYTKILKLAHGAINTADGNATVITGGLASIPSTGNGMWGAVEYLKQMYDAGAKDYFDAVGYHPYSFPLMPGDSKAWNGWQMMEDGIRGTMIANGDGDKQVWITEYGAKQSGSGVTVSPGTAAQMLREAVDLAEDTPWAGPIMWFSYQDSAYEPGFGLRDAAGKPREAYYAFKELANQDNGPLPAPAPAPVVVAPPAPAPVPVPVPAPVPTPAPAPMGKIIEGTRGNDVLRGTSGDDVLRGNGGQDTFHGGAGKDTFVFREATKWNAIKDWQEGDIIDLRSIDADIGRSGDQAFRVVGSNWLNGARDLGVYFDQANKKTYVQATVDSGKAYELNIVLDGVHKLDAGDFLL
ncbi:cellulase family glycosylhydrolase [Paracoccus sp. MC1862]|uniref:cellulase family glycosylhydrolase n=1 Tax=Paracoccus sp. MC1862 TaxID=2760307 RepID=UPI001600311F|nr:cellulase family glycosylhydrolase [Paracoccus sp. MC1862]MBB1499774.1 cellulase family glycosylhydrolase [Paracoccus sp. MC1862]QQO44214.1 cellulase family glycosylhydrolase [Paracoccus sp. MC1862]